jgi:mannosyltransferase OCH1-like enzyme
VIPQTLHQVWIGPRPVPEAWLAPWGLVMPDWDRRLWREADLADLDMPGRPLFDWLASRGRFSCASDVARAAILRSEGGVWTDADSVPLRSFTGAEFMGAGFFVGLSQAPPRVRTGTIGAVAGHPVIERWAELIAALPLDQSVHPCFRRVGGGLLTQAIADARTPDTQVLDARTFYPLDKRGNPEPGAADSFALHWWANRRLYQA